MASPIRDRVTAIVHVMPVQQAGVNISLGASYGFENYTTLQNSRNAAPGTRFYDPTRDWAMEMNEDVHAWTGSLEVARLLPRTSLRMTTTSATQRPSTCTSSSPTAPCPQRSSCRPCGTSRIATAFLRLIYMW